MKYNLGTTRSVASPSEDEQRAPVLVAARQAREFLVREDIRQLLSQGRFDEVDARAAIEFGPSSQLAALRRLLAASTWACFTSFRRHAPAVPRPYLCLSSRAVNGPNTPAKASPAGFALTA